MKTLKEALFSKKNIKHVELPYGLTQDDLKDQLEGIPMGIVVRMMEEQELQGNEPNVKVFQKSIRADKERGGFEWYESEMGMKFWGKVLHHNDFDLFFERYPDYARYNLA